MCDKNKDTRLSESEFEGFLHPQFFEHTRGIYVQENFEAFDQNSDHQIDAKEFLREHLRFVLFSLKFKIYYMDRLYSMLLFI